MTITKAERLQIVRALTTSGKAREIREASRLTLAEVGRAVGVHYSTVARWEAGGRMPRGEAALRYEALLDRLSRAVAA